MLAKSNFSRLKDFLPGCDVFDMLRHVCLMWVVWVLTVCDIERPHASSAPAPPPPPERRPCLNWLPAKGL